MTMEYDRQSTSFEIRGGCQWCGTGTLHPGVCPLVKALNYSEYGNITRVEFFDGVAEHQHDWLPWLTLPNGSSWTQCVRCEEQFQYDHVVTT